MIFSEYEFFQVIASYRKVLFAIVSRIVHNREDAMEVVSCVVYKAWSKQDTFDVSKGSFCAWLCAIARNESLDRLKSSSRYRTKLVSFTLYYEQGRCTEAEQTQKVDVTRTIQSLLAHPSLTPYQRTCITLRWLEGLSLQEIAQRLDLKSSTVKSNLTYGMRKLRCIALEQPF